VVAGVDNRDRKLLPNINVSVLITTVRHDNALTVSREAVYQDSGKRYIYRIQNGELQRAEVETAISSLTRIEVTKGLTEGTKVALGSVNGQPLSDGAAVKVVESRE
jgi:hypothetical protein